ncbi:MAG: hypothetical protein EU518_00510 [Promethearchaeota archaeon]|nr:MAG: hypothetical protein EU518_00510 [Candidatus Lokiarchaeota archaeon]
MSDAEYQNFMVFELLDNGEREKIEVDEEDLQSILAPEQVFVILNEEIRRIYIWKGAKSPVRKRFISSRVASGLQEELVKVAAYHRCKIVSVDQGDEPIEFLQTFNLESMEVKERAKDMRYIRNIDKDPSIAKGRVIENGEIQVEKEEEYYSPALEELKNKGVDISVEMSKTSLDPSSAISSTRTAKKPYSPPESTPHKQFSERKLNKKKVIEKILQQELLEDHERQNLVIGTELYGSTSKTTNVFGDDIEEIEWERIKKVPEGIYLLENYIFRIYFDKDAGIIECIEILKRKTNGTASSMNKTSITMPKNGNTLSEKILGIELPKNYNRENLIIGHQLYGAISKKVEVFGEEQTETDWALVRKIPKDIIILDSHLFRVYFNHDNETVDAIEILQKNFNKEKNNDTKKPSEKNEEKPKSDNKRNLPKIPSAD